jgi:hypothetical protein
MYTVRDFLKESMDVRSRQPAGVSIRQGAGRAAGGLQGAEPVRTGTIAPIGPSQPAQLSTYAGLLDVHLDHAAIVDLERIVVRRDRGSRRRACRPDRGSGCCAFLLKNIKMLGANQNSSPRS